MIDLDAYLERLISGCRVAFGARLCYIGLQGSYLRGEADESSDVDIMAIIDRFSVGDMDRYRELLREAGDFEKSCGFICGKEEMRRWNPLEVCQLLHTTRDLFGTLRDFLPPAERIDEINYVKLSLGNLYHELCHRYIYADREKNRAKFRGTCKSSFFLIQNLHFLESGQFLRTGKELRERVSREDRRILELARGEAAPDFDEAFAVLFAWCQDAFRRIEALR